MSCAAEPSLGPRPSWPETGRALEPGGEEPPTPAEPRHDPARLRRTLADRLCRARTARGLSAREVASRLGVHRTQLAAYEQGRQLPRIDTLVALADFYGLSVDRLLLPDAGLGPEPPGDGSGLLDRFVEADHALAFAPQPATAAGGAPRHLGERLHKHRRARGWTRAELGQRAGMHGNQIFDYEHAHRLPNAANLVRLAAALGLSLESLVRDEPRWPTRHLDRVLTGLHQRASGLSLDGREVVAELLDEVARRLWEVGS